MVKYAALVVFVVLLLGVSAVSWGDEQPQPQRWDPAREAQIGKEASAQIEAEYPLAQDQAALDKLQTIVKTLAAASDRPDVTYTCKILRSKEVNACSIPGGTVLPDGQVQPGASIYVNQGLLDFVRSDDELAGVLAHEMAHVDHHDALRQLEESSRTTKDALLAALVGVLLTKGDPYATGLTYLAGQLVQEAKTHSYTITLEKEADLAAINYLGKTDYSPVGLLTFLERLDAAGVTDPQDLGIFQDHPILVQRTIYISDRLLELGIPIDRWKVAGGESAVIANDQKGDVICHRVLIGDQVIFDPAPDEQCEQRALDCLKNLNQLLEGGLEAYELQVVPNQSQGFDLVAQGVTILSYLPSDEAFFGKSPEDLATESKEALDLALWRASFPAYRPAPAESPPKEEKQS